MARKDQPWKHCSSSKTAAVLASASWLALSGSLRSSSTRRTCCTASLTRVERRGGQLRGHGVLLGSLLWLLMPCLPMLCSQALCIPVLCIPVAPWQPYAVATTVMKAQR